LDSTCATFDRGLRAVEAFGLDESVDHWRAVRNVIHDDICTRGVDACCRIVFAGVLCERAALIL
jgi:hypothetical protein